MYAIWQELPHALSAITRPLGEYAGSSPPNRTDVAFAPFASIVQTLAELQGESLQRENAIFPFDPISDACAGDAIAAAVMRHAASRPSALRSTR